MDPYFGYITLAFPDVDTGLGGGQIVMNGGTLTMIAFDFQGQDLASSVNVAGGGDPASEINLSFLRDGGGIFVGTVEADVTAAEVLGLTADTEQLNQEGDLTLRRQVERHFSAKQAILCLPSHPL